MIRVRRYRVFLAVALASILAVYYYGQAVPWDTVDLSDFASHPQQKTPAGNQPSIPKADGAENGRPSELTSTESLDGENLAKAVTKTPTKGTHQEEHIHEAESTLPKIIPAFRVGDSEVVSPDVSDDSDKYWHKPTQFYPVPSGATIQLPTGSPKTIPRIQHQFGQSSGRADSEKLEAVKDVMRRTWNGYKTYAWGHDELKPVALGMKDPFMGWAATLVDSLDTLYIMDMKDEFEEAVKFTAEIDFTTSHRTDIPVFETTIRYLGGLLGAYDVSGAKYPILLEKALELAEVLIGAFDTPNRMPVLYYHWKPSLTSVQHRASSGAVLAEIGSLAVEFTRLAQLSKESKYYDAIARITNALELLQQNTSLPGLWPMYIDAYGCVANDPQPSSAPKGPPDGVLLGAPSRNNIRPKVGSNAFSVEGSGDMPRVQYSDKDTTSFGQDHFRQDTEDRASGEKKYLQKDSSSFGNDAKSISRRQSTVDSTLESLEDCGLRQSHSNKFTLGAMADSTYEYLPKMYILLGGLSQQYRDMYEAAMEAIDQYLLYRPMTKDDRDILFAASFLTSSFRNQGHPKSERVAGNKDPTTGHLTCFLGGMVGLAAKIFDRKEDLEKAKKLTDGCVWAYESTASGIMPEELTPVMCDVKDSCLWNETRYWDALDPNREIREQSSQPSYSLSVSRTSKPGTTLNEITSETNPQLSRRAAPAELSELRERQLGDTSDSTSKPFPDIPHPLDGSQLGPHVNPKDTGHSISQVDPTKTTTVHVQTHEEFVLNKIETYNLPPGILAVPGKYYILRPEAIESVFYMYRLTGDASWRQKGWKMFEAIDRETKTDFGASAISNALISNSSKTDSMESFWPAETLKYFYLLFSHPDVVNLDEFVLNTEAHPLLRPDATRR